MIWDFVYGKNFYKAVNSSTVIVKPPKIMIIAPGRETEAFF